MNNYRRFLCVVSFLILLPFSILLGQGSYKSSLEASFIPKVKAFSIRGVSRIDDGFFVFEPKDTSCFKEVILELNKISFLNLNQGLIKNRVFIYTDKESYCVFTFKAKDLIDELHSKMSDYNSPPQISWQVFLLKRTPFLFPIILDYNFEGRLILSKVNQSIVFNPIGHDEVIKRLIIPFNEITKVKTGMYWLFPRNVLKIITKKGVFKFTVQFPNRIKSILLQEINKQK